MDLPSQLAQQFRQLYHGGNATGSSMKEHFCDLSWKEATTKLDSLNTIAALVFHINYYVSAVLKVLEGGPLDAHDKYSYDLPPVESEDDWQTLMDTFWSDADQFASLVEELPVAKLWDIFVKEKYGNYYRNITGVIEHAHYHLGQIVIIKKILRQ